MDEPAYKVWESEIKQLREELEGSAISRIEREGVSDRVGLLKLMNQTGVESYDRALEGVIDSFYMTSYAILELAGHPIHQSSLSERIEIADVKRNIETGMNLFEEGNYQQIVDGIEALMKSVRRPETRDNYNPIPLFAMVTLYFRINRVCKKVQGLVKPIPKDIDAR